jgi:PTH1 family peptidyl-tRNA hydrolase
MLSWFFNYFTPMRPTHLLVGLGNPGPKYNNTRHNVGWWFLDALHTQYSGTDWKLEKKHQALLSTIDVDGKVYTLVKPQTFMNASGNSVLSLVAYYDIPQENICIIYDDIDLDVGVTRFKQQGSGGTHNGMRDIVTKLNESIPRLRIGVGRPTNGEDLSNFVLGTFSPNDKQVIETALQGAVSLDWLL